MTREMMVNRRLGHRQQQGVALFMSLVMLLIMTVLGVSSVQNTSMQERMARNARDSNLAFQAAESAIRDAENIIETYANITLFEAAGAESDGLYISTAFDEVPNWEAVDWEGDNLIVAPTEVDGVSNQPRYIVEFLTTVVADDDRLNLDNIGQDTGSGRAQVFRVTALGYGGTATARVMIQSTYGRRF